jgi:hypothetical protein
VGYRWSCKAESGEGIVDRSVDWRLHADWRKKWQVRRSPRPFRGGIAIGDAGTAGVGEDAGIHSENVGHSQELRGGGGGGGHTIRLQSSVAE